MTEDHSKIELTTCRTCGYQMDAASVVDGPDQEVKAGCVSICMNCGELSIFDTDTTIRVPTPQEMEALRVDPEIQDALKALREFQRLHGTVLQWRAGNN